MTVIWKVYGIVQINTEEHEIPEEYKQKFLEKYKTDIPENIKYYSEIIADGETEPVLRIPSECNYGWKRLTAIYYDRYKEKYLGSLNRTLLYHGAKVWINCPCIVYDETTKEITLKADLFSHNRRIPGERGKFYINNKPVSGNKVSIFDGLASETVKTEGLSSEEISPFSFESEVSYLYELAPSIGEGKIIPRKKVKGKTPLTVDVHTTIVNENEWTKLIARVYHTNHETYINYPGDIPQGGYVIFSVDGKRMWYDGEYKWPLNNAGFASMNVKALPSQWTVGTHTIVATYYPPKELETKYETGTIGCGTVFVGNDTNKPALTLKSKLCTFVGNENKELTFQSNTTLNGTFELYFDFNLLSSAVAVNTKNITLSFDTLGNWKQDTAYLWNYTGYHNIYIKYITYDGDINPMEYYYYLNDFYIQVPVEIQLESEEDNSTETKNGKKVYVGKNLFVPSDNSDGYEWYRSSSSEKNRTIGNIVNVNIINSFDKQYKVDDGYIRLTFVSRTENEKAEDSFE